MYGQRRSLAANSRRVFECVKATKRTDEKPSTMAFVRMRNVQTNTFPGLEDSKPALSTLELITKQAALIYHYQCAIGYAK